MKLSYAGPKVLFTRSGIDFDNNKDDKYIYLGIAVELLKAFDHEYKPNQKYTYSASSTRLSDDDIMTYIKSSFDNYDVLLKQAHDDAQGYYEHEVQKANGQKEHISELEYSSWIKNIELMEKYVLQRHFNKNIYYAVIEKVALCLKKHGITQIDAPMFQNFVHVLHSIQGALKEKPEPKSSHIDLHEEDGSLMVSLSVG